MSKFIEISKSWIISFNPTPAQKETAEHRINKCNECPHKEYLNIIDGYICGLCNCPLNGKIFSPTSNSCPDKRWEK